MQGLTRWSAILVITSALGCGVSGDLTHPGTPGGSRLCTLAGCVSGAYYFGSIPLPANIPATVDVTRCINGSCETAQVTFPTALSRVADCSTADRLYCTVSLGSDTTMASLWIEMHAPAGSDPLVSLQDGDTYDVTIGAPGAAPLVRLTATAGYKISYPNGFDCAPVCKQVQLAIAP